MRKLAIVALALGALGFYGSAFKQLRGGDHCHRSAHSQADADPTGEAE